MSEEDDVIEFDDQAEMCEEAVEILDPEMCEEAEKIEDPEMCEKAEQIEDSEICQDAREGKQAEMSQEEAEMCGMSQSALQRCQAGEIEDPEMCEILYVKKQIS